MKMYVVFVLTWFSGSFFLVPGLFLQFSSLIEMCVTSSPQIQSPPVF